MRTLSRTGIAWILGLTIAIVLLLSGVVLPLAHDPDFRMAAAWGRLLWLAVPPLFMLTLFVLLLRVILMQND